MDLVMVGGHSSSESQRCFGKSDARGRVSGSGADVWIDSPTCDPSEEAPSDPEDYRCGARHDVAVVLRRAAEARACAGLSSATPRRGAYRERGAKLGPTGQPGDPSASDGGSA